MPERLLCAGALGPALSMTSTGASPAVASFLIVDDDQPIRENLVEFLEEFGFKDVREAADGRQALARLAESVPDVMMLDLMMPDVDGFDVLQALKGAGADLRLRRTVVLSAHVDRAVATQIRELGAYARIVKPFLDQDLRGVVGVQ